MATTPTGRDFERRRRGWQGRLVRLRAALQHDSLDSRLLAGEPPSASPELEERCARLLDPRYRRELAKGLERVVEDASQPDRVCRRTPRVPLRRREIKEVRPLLLTLSRDLVEEPQVALRGVIMVDRLLRDGTSPLYAGELLFPTEHRESVEIAVRHARTALLMG